MVEYARFAMRKNNLAADEATFAQFRLAMVVYQLQESEAFVGQVTGQDDKWFKSDV